jgi:hypothetical protein
MVAVEQIVEVMKAVLLGKAKQRTKAALPDQEIRPHNRGKRTTWSCRMLLRCFDPSLNYRQHFRVNMDGSEARL